MVSLSFQLLASWILALFYLISGTVAQSQSQYSICDPVYVSCSASSSLSINAQLSSIIDWANACPLESEFSALYLDTLTSINVDVEYQLAAGCSAQLYDCLGLGVTSMYDPSTNEIANITVGDSLTVCAEFATSLLTDLDGFFAQMFALLDVGSDLFEFLSCYEIYAHAVVGSGKTTCERGPKSYGSMTCSFDNSYYNYWVENNKCSTLSLRN